MSPKLCSPPQQNKEEEKIEGWQFRKIVQIKKSVVYLFPEKCRGRDRPPHWWTCPLSSPLKSQVVFTLSLIERVYKMFFYNTWKNKNPPIQIHYGLCQCIWAFFFCWLKISINHEDSYCAVFHNFWSKIQKGRKNIEIRDKEKNTGNLILNVRLFV